MTNTNDNIPSNSTNTDLAAAWDVYQATQEAVTAAEAARQEAISHLAVAGGNKTFEANGQIYQVRSRKSKETGERFSFLSEYKRLPSEARRANHEAVVESAQQEMLEKIRTSNPEAYKALCATLEIEPQVDSDDEVEVAPKATKSKKAAKSVTVS